MQVAVLQSSPDSIVLAAPLAPNINHQATVFGGSASAVAILAAWSLVQVRLRQAGIQNDLVIQRNTMEYALPISGAFTARARMEEADWQSFLRMLNRKGRARIAVTSILEFGDKPAGRLLGEFVAFAKQA